MVICHRYRPEGCSLHNHSGIPAHIARYPGRRRDAGAVSSIGGPREGAPLISGGFRPIRSVGQPRNITE